MCPVLQVSWKGAKGKCKQDNKPDETYSLWPYLCSHMPTKDYFNRQISFSYLE